VKMPEWIVLNSCFTTVLILTCLMAQAAPASQVLVQRGAYCARAGDCSACHIAQKGQPFVGGMQFKISVGRVIQPTSRRTSKPASAAIALMIL